MKHEHSAGIIIYHKQDHTIQYLLLHYLSGHWDFAKGKLEPGETEQQAALREVKEETGLDAVIVPGFIHRISYFFYNKRREPVSKIVDYFVGYAHDTGVKISFEHIGYAWLDYEHAYKQATFQNAKELLEKAHTFIIANPQ